MSVVGNNMCQINDVMLFYFKDNINNMHLIKITIAKYSIIAFTLFASTSIDAPVNREIPTIVRINTISDTIIVNKTDSLTITLVKKIDKLDDLNRRVDKLLKNK